MERILLLVGVAEAPAEREGEADDAARETAPDSTTLGKIWTVTDVSNIN